MAKDVLHIGEEVERLRGERGWTRAELARRARTSPQTIWNIEGRHFGPSLLMAVRIADALGVSVEDLIEREAIA